MFYIQEEITCAPQSTVHVRNDVPKSIAEGYDCIVIWVTSNQRQLHMYSMYEGDTGSYIQNATKCTKRL